MTKWWTPRPTENLYLEITRRDDIGADLKAPLTGRGGGTPGGYALVPLVEPGDVIVHYNSREESIEGASVALGSPEPRAVYWAPRGRSAREAGVRPSWQPGVAVPLGGHRVLSTPISYERLQSRRSEILGIRQGLIDELGESETLYFPWYEYGFGGPLRTQQAYLLKLPRAVLALFPELADVVTTIEDEWISARGRPLPEVFEAAEGVEKAAGQSPGSSRRRSLGQGFATDQEAKVAIESHAMNAAVAHYSMAWTVEDVHGSESFDLRCTRANEELHVEVKGTTTPGRAVLLTPNEVDHARAYPNIALFVLADVVVERNDRGRAIGASGGVANVYEPWRIDDGTLKPLGYEYSDMDDGA